MPLQESDRIRLRLPDGINVWIDAPLADVQNAVQRGMASQHMIEVKMKGKAVCLVNPFQVLYIEPWTEDTE